MESKGEPFGARMLVRRCLTTREREREHAHSSRAGCPRALEQLRRLMHPRHQGRCMEREGAMLQTLAHMQVHARTLTRSLSRTRANTRTNAQAQDCATCVPLKAIGACPCCPRQQKGIHAPAVPANCHACAQGMPHDLLASICYTGIRLAPLTCAICPRVLAHAHVCDACPCVREGRTIVIWLSSALS